MDIYELIRKHQETMAKINPSVVAGLSAAIKINSAIPDFLEPVWSVQKMLPTAPIVNSGSNGFLSVAQQILGDYSQIHNNILSADYAHYIKKISLYKSPLFNVSSLFSREIVMPEIEDIEEEEEKRIILLDSVLVHENKIKSLITDIYDDNSLFYRIHPREFEEVVGELLRYHGYEVELTKQTRDNGYDILALKMLPGNIPYKALVECKRTRNAIGVGIIRSLNDVVSSENANIGILATTSYFSKDAIKKKEKTPYLLDFKDRIAITNWINEYVAHIRGFKINNG